MYTHTKKNILFFGVREEIILILDYTFSVVYIMYRKGVGVTG